MSYSLRERCFSQAANLHFFLSLVQFLISPAIVLVSHESHTHYTTSSGMPQLTLKQCYDSRGLPGDNIPCDPNAEVSACCGTGGSQCIDNLHCINPSGGSVPGTCTFQSWVSGTEPACPCPPVYLGNDTALDYRDGVTFCPDGGFVCGKRKMMSWMLSYICLTFPRSVKF